MMGMMPRGGITRSWSAKQSGISIMLLLLMVSVVGLGIFLGVARSDSDDKLKRDQKTEAALARARQALIDYAVQYDKTHAGEAAGYLPCPDEGTGAVEGQSTPPCRTMNVSAIGRFPWYTLDMEDLRDGSGECLWYAASGTFKNNPKNTSLPFNWDAAGQGQFEVYADDGLTKLAGSSSDNSVVAVIIAPGAAQGAAQTRSGSVATAVCGGDYVAAHYLDSAFGIDNGSLSTPPVAGAITKFIQGKESNTFNDRLVYITAADIFNAIERRPDFYSTPGTGNGIVRGMMAMVAGCIANRAQDNTSAGNALVWAADSTVFSSLNDFTTDAMYTDASMGRFGRVPFDISASTVKTVGGGNQLMVAGYCGAGWNSLSGWWAQWKDHFFYAVAKGQAPDSGGDCSADSSCLTVNGTGAYAGVVLFGGRKLAAQTRTSAVNRQDRVNYLEANNQTVIPGSGPANATVNNFVTLDNPWDAALNDLTYCVENNPAPPPNMHAVPCH